MKKTTIYLPDELKARVEAAARTERRSEADIIRDAITAAVGLKSVPDPHVPLTRKGLGDPTIAERIDDLLHEFGR